MMNVDANSFILNDIDSNVIAIHKMLCGYIGHEKDFYDQLFHLANEYKLSLSFSGQTVPNELKKQFPKTYYAKYNKYAYKQLKDNEAFYPHMFIAKCVPNKIKDKIILFF